MMRSLAASLIGLVVMAGSAVSVDAGPISGMFGGDSTLTPASTPGIFTQAYTGDGTDATFGAFTVQSNSIIDFSHPPALHVEDGTFTQTFAEGMLFGTSSGTGTTSGMGTGTATVDVVYTGGTGLFAGRHGSGDNSADDHEHRPDHSVGKCNLFRDAYARPGTGLASAARHGGSSILSATMRHDGRVELSLVHRKQPLLS